MVNFKLHKVTISVLFLLLAAGQIHGLLKAQNTGKLAESKGVREKLLLDFGWKFSFGDASSVDSDFGYGSGKLFAKAGEPVGAVKPDFNDSSWRSVDLPHDWVVEMDFVNLKDEYVKEHGFKPVGRQFPKTTVGWYRRAFTLPVADEGRRIAVKFDGVFRDCIAWINGHYLGSNLSGYSEFSFDISDYVNFGRKNVLVLRVDAGNYEGWFYEGAGIYRHTWLIKYSPLHIPGYGTFVTSEAGKNSAVVNIETKIVNQGETRSGCLLDLRVMDEKGNKAGSAVTSGMRFGEGEEKTVRQKITVRNPLLWSLETPHLYTLVSVLRSGAGASDSTETVFGVRTLRFDKENGFFLNGRLVKIKGVCCHQDHAGVGSALPDRLQYYRIEKLKEMGCNAYRTSHNPPTPELLEACDRLGMLVMDENRLMGSSPELLGQFEKLILRDRNHPSVFIWSLGNEEWFIQDGKTGRNIALSLKRAANRLDPTRLSTYAANNGNQYEGVNSVVDVRGINYIVLGDPDKYHRDHPAQPVMGSEEASTLCTRGIYSNDTSMGYVSDYDLNVPDWGSTAEKSWKFYSDRKWLAGVFIWTGFDYRGEPTPYSWPCINSHFGIMDVCGFPKNNYYYYQSWWSDKDVLHLAPHWNWSEGKPVSVWCQSNSDSVELFLNSRSLGRKKMEPNSHLQWEVPYEPGVLEARGFRGGRVLTAKVETAGRPEKLRLDPDRQVIKADGEDLCIVNITALDSSVREVATADNLLKFELKGSGRIIGVGNGNPSSHEADKYLDGKYQRRLFNGKCQVILESTRQAGSMELVVYSEGMKPGTVTIRTEPCQVRASIE